MTSVNEWGYVKKKNRPFSMVPRDPEKILEIVRLRDQENMRWRKIGQLMGMSHQGPYVLYKRWYEWAKGQQHGTK